VPNVWHGLPSRLHVPDQQVRHAFVESGRHHVNLCDIQRWLRLLARGEQGGIRLGFGTVFLGRDSKSPLHGPRVGPNERNCTSLLGLPQHSLLLAHQQIQYWQVWGVQYVQNMSGPN